jgi:hypothetical protein
MRKGRIIIEKRLLRIYFGTEEYLYYNIIQYIIEQENVFKCLTEPYLPSTLLNVIEKYLYEN